MTSYPADRARSILTQSPKLQTWGPLGPETVELLGRRCGAFAGVDRLREFAGYEKWVPQVRTRFLRMFLLVALNAQGLLIASQMKGAWVWVPQGFVVGRQYHGGDPHCPNGA